MTNYPLASSTWDEREIEAIQNVIKSGRFTMGEQVSSFEVKFAEAVGAKFAVMVNSGSSANLALLAACRYREDPKIAPGDEILVPAVSWSTTYYPINQIGATLKFVDVDPFTLNIDTKKIESAITSKTRGIFAVNLLGNPAKWTELKKLADDHNLFLLEDNCESLGANIDGKQAGTFGFGGTFSTFFSHHISTMEGGLIVTDDEPLSHTLKSVRAHGWTRDLPEENYVHNRTGRAWDDLFRFVIPGYNIRPLEMEAAIGKIQLEKLPSFILMRRRNASFLKEAMKELSGFRMQEENGESSWFGFSFVLEGKLRGRREQLIDLLNEAEIESRPIVTGNFTRNPVIRHLDHAPIGPLPGADEVHDNGLFVGNHHYDLSKELSLLVDLLRKFQRRF